jgi:succinylarginine dihydrolase
MRPRHQVHRRPDAQDADLRRAARREREGGDGPAAPERPRGAADARGGRLRFDRYIDIFDGGPTVTARPTRSAPSANARRDGRLPRSATAGKGRCSSRGRLKDFRACCASVKRLPRRRASASTRGGRAARVEVGDQMVAVAALMALVEINFDGIVGPSHNYAGLSLGNLASTRNAGACRSRARGAPGHRQDARQSRARPAQGIFLPHPRPHRPGWPSSARRSRRPSRRSPPTHVGLGDVGGQCGDGLAGARHRRRQVPPDRRQPRTMPHRSHEWPATLASCGSPSRRAHFAGARPVPPAFGDEGAANHMRLAPAHGEPGVEIFVYGVSGGAFPARQHLEASKAIARLHRLDPERTIFAEQSEEAIAAGAFHNDVVAVANERVLFAHEQAFADKRPLLARCERLVPGFEYVEVPAPTCRSPTRSVLSVQRPAGDPPDGEPTLIVPTEARETPAGVALDRAAHRRQRPDPPGRGRRRAPVDGQWRRPGLPAPARRRRSGDGRSALPGRRGEARPTAPASSWAASTRAIGSGP